jgi:hypothetical protein
MSNEELEGRLAALEVIAMTALGFCVANTRNDPDYRRAGEILASMRDALKTQAATLPPAARDHASRFGNHLIDAVAKNLRVLRGEVGQLN